MNYRISTNSIYANFFLAEFYSASFETPSSTYLGLDGRVESKSSSAFAYRYFLDLVRSKKARKLNDILSSNS